MNSFDITLFVVAYIIGFAISLAIFYTLNMVSHEKSKFNEKYKALNERFMHKKRDKTDG